MARKQQKNSSSTNSSKNHDARLLALSFSQEFERFIEENKVPPVRLSTERIVRFLSELLNLEWDDRTALRFIIRFFNVLPLNWVMGEVLQKQLFEEEDENWPSGERKADR